jgi:hypothetical protein
MLAVNVIRQSRGNECGTTTVPIYLALVSRDFALGD